MNLILRFAAAALCLAIAPAQATFHLWRMTEIYSSPDGSVQFLELGDCCNGENLLAGHQLRATGPFGTHTFEFPTDLPTSNTAAKRFLVGTQSFADLHVVTPDYIVPDNFFSPSGGSVNFASVDTWNYGPLPTDTRSLSRDGSMETNSPKNLAGAAGTVPALLSFQALWYRSPAESERGWGVNLTHQGDILFATWFTYDSTGKGMWIVGPDVRRTTGNTFTGALYRTTGPAFNANPWNPNAVAVQMVGSATFAFSDLDNGTFSYTVDGISQSKPITRQVYSSPATVCH